VRRSIRCGSGLGDSLYLQAAVRHLVERGRALEVCSDWPDVFRPLAGRVTLSPFRREVDIRAHYAMRKRITTTDQFQDVCIAAGITEPVDFRLDWVPQNERLIDRVRGDGTRPVVLVLLPRRPMDRKDGFGDRLLPNCEVIGRAIEILRPHARIVQVGKGDALYRFGEIDLDLSNATSVADMIDAAWAADGLLGYVSFFVPLAESLLKPALFVWSRRGLESSTDFIAQITPSKILHRATSRAVIDNCTDQQLAEAVNEFRRQIGGAQPLRGQAGGDRRVGAGVPG